MKKTIAFLSLLAVITTAACNNKPTEEKKEIIVTPPPADPVVKDPPEKEIKINVDTAGMKVETRKVDVSVNKD